MTSSFDGRMFTVHIEGRTARVHHRDLDQLQFAICRKLPQILAGMLSTSARVVHAADRAWLEIRCDGLGLRLELD